jgi:hypothetical protein
LSGDTGMLSNHNKSYQPSFLINRGIIHNLKISKETSDMKKFKEENFCPECAEKHLRTLKAKLTNKKLTDILADQDLENGEMAVIEAQKAVQEAKEHKNETQNEAKEAKKDVLRYSKAMEITPFTGRIR